MALFTEERQHNSKEAPKNNKTLLLDSDTVCFHSILQCTSEEILMDRGFYSDEAWAIIEQEEGYNPIKNTLRTLNFEQAKKAFDYKVESLLLATGCKDVKFYVTGWLPTFRHYLDPQYKSDRKGGERPLRLSEFKWWLVQERGAHISGYFEADELLAYEYLQDPDNHIVASVDKDLLLQLPGTHFDYYSKRFKYTETTEADSVYNFHHRLLTGDRGDYILTGLTRVGDKTAIKLLAPAKTKWENGKFETVEEYRVELYRLVRKEYIRQNNGNLFRMFNMVGADYLGPDGFKATSPKFDDDKCPYCIRKKEENEEHCGKHELREVSPVMPIIDFDIEDTHLMKGIAGKKGKILELWKLIVNGWPTASKELLDIERFYLFASMKINDWDAEIHVLHPDINKPISEQNIEFKIRSQNV